MKNIPLLIIAIAVILSLVLGCAAEQNPVTTQPPTTSSPSPTVPSTPVETATPGQTPPPETEYSPVSVEGNIEVHFIDVGQGDAILIDWADIEILIDGGDRSPGVASYLKRYIDGPLEVLIATHPHADHIGGLIEVLAVFEVEEVWHNGDTTTSKTYADFMAAVTAENAQVFQAIRGMMIETNGLVFNILHPENINGTTNNNSVVLQFTFGDIAFLFTGDAEIEAEASMIADGLVIDLDILKIGHHGSRTASSMAFLAKSQPELAIYMAATGNTYGHPHDETIASLNQMGVEILGTDINGTIIVATDGKTFSVQTVKEGTVPSSSTSPPAPITEPSPGGVRIESIDLAAEVVIIKNTENTAVDMNGWKLISEVGNQQFIFPALVLQPGEVVKVTSGANAKDNPSGELLWTKSYIWNNDGDPGALYNASGILVSRCP